METTMEETPVIMKRHLYPHKHRPWFIYRACGGCRERFRVRNIGGYFSHIATCKLYKARYES
jgi:hypothetical protein